jgi:UrcA family protein
MTTAASPEKAPHEARNLFPKVTLAMLICGIFGAVAAGAATPDPDVQTVKVKYDPAMLATESGARHFYAHLQSVAAEVCPDDVNPHLVSHQVAMCREHAVQAAVMKINNPRLVAVYQSNAHIG